MLTWNLPARSTVVARGIVPALALVATVLAAPAAESRVLFDFERGFDVATVQTADAQVAQAKSSAGSALRIVTGHRQPWPGVTLRAPQGQWDLSAYSHVAATVRNPGKAKVSVACRVDNAGADGRNHCVSQTVSLEPSQTRTLAVRLNRTQPGTLGGKLFGLRGYPVAPGGAGTLDPTRVTQLLFFVNKPSADLTFEVDDIRAEGAYTPPTASVTDADPFFPLIDTFGQYRHKDWPGKVHSLQELAARRTAEEKELAANPGPRDWNSYGGWAAGPQLKATGFFRVEKHRGKWWLVDPTGRLFFSQGIDSVRMHDATAIEERADWFHDFPGDRPEFAEFIIPKAHALKGHYAGRSPKCYSFAGANLKRKYGPDWRRIYPEVIHRRLRSWGLNTIANWSDETTRLLRRTPYTDAVSSGAGRRIEGSAGYWAKFVDPFDASFREGVKRSMAGKRGKSAGDAWCLGYFSDNEMAWGDDVSLALAALQSPPDQPAKRVFLEQLRKTYGDIAKLNAAWGVTHPSWEDLAQNRTAPDRKRAQPDLEIFYSRVADEYFRTVRDIIKEAAPNQLYLGCRFAWVNARAAASAAKFCDVVSYNLYRRSVADFQFNGGADVPLIIGEFHFGALDRGMFHTGLVPVANQAERAQTYRDYVLGALRHPQFVGCHWFEYQDEPTTGRVLDEENYQIGFVDIGDTPYAETVGACREVAARMYAERLGN